MKLLIAATILLAGTAVGHADKRYDDYMACLIGQSAIALMTNEVQWDADKAQKVAFAICKKRAVPISEEDEGFEDTVNSMVQNIASGGVCPKQ